MVEALPDKGDCVDWLAAHLGATADDIRNLQTIAAPETQITEPEPESKKSASTTLVEMAEKLFDFGVSDLGETFAIPKSGPEIVALLRGNKTSLRDLLARRYFQLTYKAASQQALADALLLLDGMAQEQEPEELHIRVAAHEGTWLDLGDQTGKVVHIIASGWAIEDHLPVLFKRTKLTSALPQPDGNGTTNDLFTWLNVTKKDRPLLIAWLVAVLNPDIPHPVLLLQGEQGSGKRTAAQVLAQALDQSPVPKRKAPRDAESWVTAAAGSWVVCLDNLSHMPEWLSDSICRAVTGEGDIRRQLYTDGDHAIFTFKRCVILNGIDIGALRGDLSDRLIDISLHSISDSQRIEEQELWPRWNEVHPRILGAILNIAVKVAGILPNIKLERKPRMADFARILAAVDQVLGTNGLEHYSRKQNQLATDSLTDDIFVGALNNQLTAEFKGTSAELLDKIKAPESRPKSWPATARAVTQRLKRQAPVMRKAGWAISDDGGQNHTKTLIWTIRQPARADNPSPQYPQFPQNDDSGNNAGNAGIKYGQSQDDDLCPPCLGEGCKICGGTGKRPSDDRLAKAEQILRRKFGSGFVSLHEFKT